MTAEFASIRIVRAGGGLSSTAHDIGNETSSPVQSDGTKGIYIAWVNYQRRVESMQQYFGYDVFYLSSKHGSAASKFVSYLMQAMRMFRIIARERPDIVWLQLPPTFLIHLAILYRLLMRRSIRIVADCHNAALRPPWRLMPLNAFFLRRADMVLVHNHAVVSAARRFGIDEPQLRVLGDCVPALAAMDGVGELQDHPTIVMPCSFHDDEPIETVLEVARRLEMATFVITGNHARIRDRALLDGAPTNVVFSGFLPLVEFDRLLLRASAILCLTLRDDIQLSAASEAIAAGKPMVISDTEVLRTLFGEAGIFVDNTAVSILQGCRTAIEQYEKYSGAAKTMRARRVSDWRAQAEPIHILLRKSGAG
jgi:glycosyltransferase involved in cell wall biosynthesis